MNLLSQLSYRIAGMATVATLLLAGCAKKAEDAVTPAAELKQGTAVAAVAGYEMSAEGNFFASDPSKNVVKLTNAQHSYTLAGKEVVMHWLTVALPADMKEGAYTLTVTANGQTATAPLKVQVWRNPEITGVAISGDDLTLTGVRFGDRLSDMTVHVVDATNEFAVYEATVTSVTDTELRASVPATLPTGNYRILVRRNLVPLGTSASTGAYPIH